MTQYQIDTSDVTAALDGLVENFTAKQKAEEQTMRARMLKALPMWKKNNYLLGELLNWYQDFYRENGQGKDTFKTFLRAIDFAEATGFRMTALYRAAKEVDSDIREYAYLRHIDIAAKVNEPLRKSILAAQKDEALLKAAPDHQTAKSTHDRAAFIFSHAYGKRGEYEEKARNRVVKGSPFDSAPSDQQVAITEAVQSFVKSCVVIKLTKAESIQRVREEWERQAPSKKRAAA